MRGRRRGRMLFGNTHYYFIKIGHSIQLIITYFIQIDYYNSLLLHQNWLLQLITTSSKLAITTHYYFIKIGYYNSLLLHSSHFKVLMSVAKQHFPVGISHTVWLFTISTSRVVGIVELNHRDVIHLRLDTSRATEPRIHKTLLQNTLGTLCTIAASLSTS